MEIHAERTPDGEYAWQCFRCKADNLVKGTVELHIYKYQPWNSHARLKCADESCKGDFILTPVDLEPFEELWEEVIEEDFAPSWLANTIARINGHPLPSPRQLRPEEVVELRDFHNKLDQTLPEDF